MNVAQERVLKLAAWLERNSQSRAALVGNDTWVFGKFATIVPIDFAAEPPIEWHTEALPLFVSESLTDGLRLPAIDLGDAPSQPSAFDRLGSIIFRAQDYTLPATCALFALTVPGQPIEAAIEAQGGLAGLDPAITPVLAVPVWQFSFNQRQSLRTSLPFRPKADAIDGPDGPWMNQESAPKPRLNLGLKTSWSC